MVIYHKDVLKILNIADFKTLQTKHNCECVNLQTLQQNVHSNMRYFEYLKVFKINHYLPHYGEANELKEIFVFVYSQKQRYKCNNYEISVSQLFTELFTVYTTTFSSEGTCFNKSLASLWEQTVNLSLSIFSFTSNEK